MDRKYIVSCSTALDSSYSLLFIWMPSLLDPVTNSLLEVRRLEWRIVTTLILHLCFPVIAKEEFLWCWAGNDCSLAQPFSLSDYSVVRRQLFHNRFFQEAEHRQVQMLYGVMELDTAPVCQQKKGNDNKKMIKQASIGNCADTLFFPSLIFPL